MIEDEDLPAHTGERSALLQPVRTEDEEAGTPPAAGGMTGADFQLYIGRGLRAVFDDVAKQPVPDRFLELMKKLG